MIEIINDKTSVSSDEAEDRYQGCIILLINSTRKDNTLYGEVYAISDSVDSHNELLDMEASLIENGIKTTLAGEYKSDRLISLEHRSLC